MSRRTIGKSELQSLLREGWTGKQIAKYFGVSLRTVRRAIEEYDLKQRKQLDHKKWIPWKIRGEHRSSEYEYLRRLSTLAQGGDVSEKEKLTAINWARDAVRDGLDLWYDRESGFYWYYAESDSQWLLRDLLREVEKREN